MSKTNKSLIIIFSTIALIFWPLFYVVNYFLDSFNHLKSILNFEIPTLANNSNWWLLVLIFFVYFVICFLFSFLFVFLKSRKTIFWCGMIQFSILIIFLFFDVINRFYVNHFINKIARFQLNSFLYLSIAYFIIIFSYIVILLISLRNHYFYFNFKNIVVKNKNNHLLNNNQEKDSLNKKTIKKDIKSKEKFQKFLDEKFQKIFEKYKNSEQNKNYDQHKLIHQIKELNIISEKNNNLDEKKVEQKISQNIKKPSLNQKKWITPSDYKDEYIKKGKKIKAQTKIFLPKRKQNSNVNIDKLRDKIEKDFLKSSPKK